MTPTEDRTDAYHVVMLSFDGVDTAGRVLERVKAEKGLLECEIEAEALISRDAAGHVHYHERGAAGIGATFGIATAIILGLVAGPILLLVMVVAGGVAGGVAGHYAGQALPREDLRRVAESLPPGSSGYIAVVDGEHADCVVDSFAPEGKVIVNATMETELASAIRETIAHGVERA